MGGKDEANRKLRSGFSTSESSQTTIEGVVSALPQNQSQIN